MLSALDGEVPGEEEAGGGRVAAHQEPDGVRRRAGGVRVLGPSRSLSDASQTAYSRRTARHAPRRRVRRRRSETRTRRQSAAVASRVSSRALLLAALSSAC